MLSWGEFPACLCWHSSLPHTWSELRLVGATEIFAWDKHFLFPLAPNKLQMKQLGLAGFSCHSL